MDNEAFPPGYAPPSNVPPAAQYGPPSRQSETRKPYAGAQAPGYNVTITNQPSTTVVINQPVSGASFYGPMPCNTTCPQCTSTMTTRVDNKLSRNGWMWVIILCVLGFWPCCLLPFCMDGCQDYTHYCTNCGRCLGGTHP